MVFAFGLAVEWTERSDNSLTMYNLFQSNQDLCCINYCATLQNDIPTFKLIRGFQSKFTSERAIEGMRKGFLYR